MTLIDFPVNDIHVTATTIGEHCALHPAIMVDQETGELSLDTVNWSLVHVPSGKQLSCLYQSDPVEWPGEPRALNPLKVAAFVGWLETRLDLSDPDVEFSALTDDDRRVISDFYGDPNYFTAPGSDPKADEPPVTFGPDGFTVTVS